VVGRASSGKAFGASPRLVRTKAPTAVSVRLVDGRVIGMMISDNDRVNKQKEEEKRFRKGKTREINQKNNRYWG
jgi:hypothetical protein